MEFRQLVETDTESFVALIKDMYKSLENLEWFSPMPYDVESVKAIIANPRFFITGVFENDELCAVSSLDFKCGKLIGQNYMPSYCTLDNTAEIGFTMVKSSFKGQGLMKQLVKHLEKHALLLNKKYLFGKVHVDNLASYKSFIYCGFKEFSKYNKIVKRAEFEQFLSSDLLSPTTIAKAKESLKRDVGDVVVQYSILIKKL